MDISDSGAAQQNNEEELNPEAHGMDCSDEKIQDAGPSSTPAEKCANNSACPCDYVIRSLQESIDDEADEELKYINKLRKVLAYQDDSSLSSDEEDEMFKDVEKCEREKEEKILEIRKKQQDLFQRVDGKHGKLKQELEDFIKRVSKFK